MSQRKGGICIFKIDGTQYQAKGNFSYGLGEPTREGMAGADGVHGYKETPTVPFVEGEITDGQSVSLTDLARMTEQTVTLQLANGKVIALRQAWSCNPDGMKGETEDGKVAVRFEGISAEEIR